MKASDIGQRNTVRMTSTALKRRNKLEVDTDYELEGFVGYRVLRHTTGTELRNSYVTEREALRFLKGLCQKFRIPRDNVKIIGTKPIPETPELENIPVIEVGLVETKPEIVDPNPATVEEIE
jgi:hypothetical protein